MYQIQKYNTEILSKFFMDVPSQSKIGRDDIDKTNNQNTEEDEKSPDQPSRALETKHPNPVKIVYVKDEKIKCKTISKMDDQEHI